MLFFSVFTVTSWCEAIIKQEVACSGTAIMRWKVISAKQVDRERLQAKECILYQSKAIWPEAWEKPSDLLYMRSTTVLCAGENHSCCGYTTILEHCLVCMKPWIKRMDFLHQQLLCSLNDILCWHLLSRREISGVNYTTGVMEYI